MNRLPRGTAVDEFHINLAKKPARRKPNAKDYADPSARLTAALGDWGIVSAVAAIVSAGLSAFSSRYSGIFWFLLAFAFLGWLYFAAYEGGRYGSTPIKKFLLMRVADRKRGLNLGFPRATVRQLIKLLPVFAGMQMVHWYRFRYRTVPREGFRLLAIFIVVYGLVQLALLLRRDRRLLHDFAAGSVVRPVPISKRAPAPTKPGPSLEYGD